MANLDNILSYLASRDDWKLQDHKVGTADTITVPDSAKEVLVIVFAGSGQYTGYFNVKGIEVTRPVIGGYYYASNDYGGCFLNVSNNNKSYNLRSVRYASVDRASSADMYVYYR